MNKRYTTKGEHGYTYRYDLEMSQFVSASLGLNKLGKIEDFEEEYGVDLLVFVVAFQNGFWTIDENGDTEHHTCIGINFKTHTIVDWLKKKYDFRDFGITWCTDKSLLYSMWRVRKIATKDPYQALKDGDVSCVVRDPMVKKEHHDDSD